MMETLAYLGNLLGSFYLLALLLRFLLQAADADYYNPVSQMVVRLTDPPVRLFRSLVPGRGRIDFAILALAADLEIVFVIGLGYLHGLFDSLSSIAVSILHILGWAAVGLVTTLLDIIFFAVIISIIMSFVVVLSGNQVSHPALRLAMELAEPMLAPFRRILPSMGGLDFSPIFLFISVMLIEGLLSAAIPTSSGHKLIIIGSDSILINFVALMGRLSGI